MKNLKESGITLIALVVTIIILLILAGVTISLIWNGGIINKSQQAVDTQSEAQAREQLNMALLAHKVGTMMKEGKDLEYYIKQIDSEGTVDEESDNNYYIIQMLKFEFIVKKDTLEVIGVEPLNGPTPKITDVGKTLINDSKNMELIITVETVNNGNVTMTMKNSKGNIIPQVDEKFVVSKNGEYTIVVKEAGVRKKASQIINVEGIIGAKYAVTVTGGDNVTVTGGGNIAEETSTTITATPKSGYAFVRWNVINGESTDVADLNSATTIVTPTSDIEIEAQVDKGFELIATIVERNTDIGATSTLVNIEAKSALGIVTSFEATDGATIETNTSTTEKIFRLNNNQEYHFKITTGNGNSGTLGLKVETKSFSMPLSGEYSGWTGTANYSYTHGKGSDHVWLRAFASNGSTVKYEFNPLSEMSEYSAMRLTFESPSEPLDSEKIWFVEKTPAGWVERFQMAGQGVGVVSKHSRIFNLQSGSTGFQLEAKCRDNRAAAWTKVYEVELLRIVYL